MTLPAVSTNGTNWSNPIAVLMPLYRGQLTRAHIANLTPFDPHLAKQHLVDTMVRCLDGEAGELDHDIAESLRQNMCQFCTDTRPRNVLAHFCAAVLLNHLMPFSGAGFGHAEAPLVIALCAIREGGAWAAASADFLQAILTRQIVVEFGELAIPAVLAWHVVTRAGRRPLPETHAPAALAMAENVSGEKLDLHTPSLAHLLATEMQHHGIQLPDDAQRAITLLQSRT